MSRNFLGDEVHLLQSDIAVLKGENELLKMSNERKAEENRILTEQLHELQAEYRLRSTETVAISTILEQVSAMLVSALSKSTARRKVREEHAVVAKPVVETRVPPRAHSAAPTVPAMRLDKPRIITPNPREDNEPMPEFLTSTRLPAVDLYDQDQESLRDLHNDLENKSRRA
jgi:hypothetical protein